MLPTSQDKRQPKLWSPKALALAVLLGPCSSWEPHRECVVKDPPALVSTAVGSGLVHKGQCPH